MEQLIKLNAWPEHEILPVTF